MAGLLSGPGLRWAVRVLFRTIGLVVLLSLLAAAVARAASSEVDALRQEVTALRQTVEGFESRLENLERQLTTRPGSSPQQAANPRALDTDAPRAPTPDTSLRDRWHRITRGMSEQEVDGLLGRPARTIDLNPKTVWYYSYPDVGSGSVVFVHDEGVVDWQTPPFNTWW